MISSNPYIEKIKRNPASFKYGVINNGGILCCNCIIQHEEWINQASANILQSGYDDSGWFVISTDQNKADRALFCSFCSAIITTGEE